MRGTAAHSFLHAFVIFVVFVLFYVFWNEEEVVSSLPGAIHHFTDHIQDDIYIYFNVIHLLLATNVRYRNLCLDVAVITMLLRVEQQQQQQYPLWQQEGKRKATVVWKSFLKMTMSRSSCHARLSSGQKQVRFTELVDGKLYISSNILVVVLMIPQEKRCMVQ